jgi:hypothetical protein
LRRVLRAYLRHQFLQLPFEVADALFKRSLPLRIRRRDGRECEAAGEYECTQAQAVAKLSMHVRSPPKVVPPWLVAS